ncbi:hypothetical protein PG996_012788, partial [Apiospora saccharicola]
SRAKYTERCPRSARKPPPGRLALSPRHRTLPPELSLRRPPGPPATVPSTTPPSGWLFGVKPGEKYQKEGWETPFYYGFCGTFALAAIAYAFKPDTSIQTWALEEARRRLEAEGILEDPDKKR